jgi:hypothetical protein
MLPKQFNFLFNENQRARFRSGELVVKWHARYPEILDDDVRILAGHAQRQYHFFEFLSAVLIYAATRLYVDGREVRDEVPRAQDRTAVTLSPTFPVRVVVRAREPGLTPRPIHRQPGDWRVVLS